MVFRVAGAAVIATVLSAWPAQAAEKTVVLNVENASCPLCVPIVRMTLQGVAGVKMVEVEENYLRSPPVTAMVVFDDALTNIEALTEATANQGYPSYEADWRAP